VIPGYFGVIVREAYIPFIVVEESEMCYPNAMDLEEICLVLLSGYGISFIVNGLFALCDQLDRRREIILSIIAFLLGFATMLDSVFIP
jgi:hypothetical protein